MAVQGSSGLDIGWVNTAGVSQCQDILHLKASGQPDAHASY